MEDSEKNIEREAIKLPWKPILSPEARKVFQKKLIESSLNRSIDEECEGMEYWYVEEWRITDLARPYLDAILNDPKKDYPQNTYFAWELESLDLLFDQEDTFPNIIPDSTLRALEGEVDGVCCTFFPYEVLKKGGYLLHSREEYLNIFMQFAMASQKPNTPALPSLTVEPPAPSAE